MVSPSSRPEIPIISGFLTPEVPLFGLVIPLWTTNFLIADWHRGAVTEMSFLLLHP
ncbi:hypothetical protein HNR46_000134 [Haloferula luteola]|uniref:Uncharacterized protein n=1 Tax=Haloferula luteola TaxID=595692 RepID=A0A840UY68_9BACT|nr:hypothetical protein [Haloferula luteola]